MIQKASLVIKSLVGRSASVSTEFSCLLMTDDMKPEDDKEEEGEEGEIIKSLEVADPVHAASNSCLHDIY